ncbi:hypothetical protein MC378_10340 [Polaribacter sp. MSW13]|uniref:Uncharacterized protein n=1 Tax=Polaribacter marinus TaxID=2916838 RepID=A0A9X1VNV1_9FLAO|nr:hypothetical protein [Polaribacter marinus]MCI2229566.1 hypothetical protein [Polaribacter marinus]
MNIETLLQKSQLFIELVIDSGLQRDLQDYQNTLNQNQNKNLIFLNDVNSKIQSKLLPIYNSSLPDDLKVLIKKATSFTEREYLKEFERLENDPKIEAQGYFTQFNSLLISLLRGINSNYTEIKKLKDVIDIYAINHEDIESIEDYYPICLKFNDEKITNGLKDLHRTLRIWNITLLNYQTLVSSESPEQIRVQSVNDGCIEFVLDYAWNVAEKFAGVIDTFSTYYVSYLAAKNTFNKIFGNKSILSKKLQQQNEKTIKMMFDEMEENLKEYIGQQVKEAKSKDEDIINDGTETKKIEVIAKSVINHFLRGNEVKFLIPFHDYEQLETEEEIEKLPEDITRKIRENTSKAKIEYKSLNEADKKLLLGKYSITDLDDLEDNTKTKSAKK